MICVSLADDLSERIYETLPAHVRASVDTEEVQRQPLVYFAEQCQAVHRGQSRRDEDSVRGQRRRQRSPPEGCRPNLSPS